MPSKARSVVEATGDQKFFSVASLWEIAIKVSLGRLELAAPHGPFVRQVLVSLGMELLAISAEHVERVASLPFHHRDPFDRLLVAQAMHEGIALITQDPQFSKYDIPVIG